MDAFLFLSDSDNDCSIHKGYTLNWLSITKAGSMTSKADSSNRGKAIFTLLPLHNDTRF